MAQQYSTKGLREAERFSFWADSMCQSYCAATCESLSDRVFEGDIALSQFGAVVMSHVQSAPIAYHRGEKDLYRDSPGVFYVALTQCEEAYVIQDQRQSRLADGDIVLFDSTRAYSCHFPKGDNQIICAIPRELLLQYLPHANELTAITLATSSVMANLAAGMIREAAKLPADTDSLIASRLGVSLVEILALTFESGLGKMTSGINVRQHELLKKIKNYMMANLSDAALNLEQVAAAHHISSRTLNRLFATEGTTAIRWLWQSRLTKSYKMLIERKTDQVSVTALEAGFSNFSHFSNAFKKNFGMSPQALLKKVSAGKLND